MHLKGATCSSYPAHQDISQDSKEDFALDLAA